MDISFYHLDRADVGVVLPTLVGKMLRQTIRAVVECADEVLRDKLDDALWTHTPTSFLPHGSARHCEDGSAQPIWLTTGDDTPNAATLRVFVGAIDVAGAISRLPAQITRLLILFDGLDEEALVHAREQWTLLKKQAHELTYWQQSDDGGWQKAG